MQASSRYSNQVYSCLRIHISSTWPESKLVHAWITDKQGSKHSPIKEMSCPVTEAPSSRVAASAIEIAAIGDAHVVARFTMRYALFKLRFHQQITSDFSQSNGCDSAVQSCGYTLLA